MADISKRLEKADKYIQKGNREAALEEYLHILQDEPNNDSVRQTAVDLCTTLGRTGEAAELLSVLFDRQASIGDVAKAVITYKKLARSGKPTVDQLYRYSTYVEKSARKEALEGYETAVQAFVASNRSHDALAALKRIVALEPTAENLKREGELAEAVGDQAGAATAFVRAGELLEASKAESFPWFERAYNLDPTNNQAALDYGRVLTAKGQADAAIKILAVAATPGSASAELRLAYGKALASAGKVLEAEPIIWKLFESDSRVAEDVTRLLAALIDADQHAKALEVARKFEQHQQRVGQRREAISILKDIADKHPPGTEFLEYLVQVFNNTNREHDYCETLLKLFELYYAQGNFIKAGDSLDRAAEVDAYEPGHQRRLEMLRGKIDANRFNAIANRFQTTVNKMEEEETKAESKEFEKEPTILEDLMLQAEIFLQYSMRSKAMERLERIHKLFPHEEEKNDKLRLLYANAGLFPKYETPAAPAAEAAPASSKTPPMPAPVQAAPISAPTPKAVSDEAAVDNFARVTEITRNIYRQGNVKGVLFAAVNDVGRHWNASRCLAGLCSPGKPPSAALEYCAPGVKASEVMAIVKLITTLQTMAVEKGVIAINDVAVAPELEPIRSYIHDLNLESVLAVPLSDGEEHMGILILQQCGPRGWRQTDIVVLKTIADQMVQAVQNARLRSLVKTLAVTDEKSGLLKRSSYLDVLLSEVRRSLPQSSPVTLMLMHFGRASALVKEVGEPAVETMMQQIGQTICSHIRQNDVAVRYDLTTIALVLSDTNDKNSFFVVDKLRKVLGSVRTPGKDTMPPITVGIAEAVMQQKFDSIDIVTEVINRAEAALDAAHAAGGNKAQSLAPQLETAAVA